MPLHWRELQWHSSFDWRSCMNLCPQAVCIPTNSYGTTRLKCLCSPSAGPRCLPVPSEQRQTWHSFPHPPAHRLLSSGRNWRYWSCPWTAGCSSQPHVRAKQPEHVTALCHMATQDDRFGTSVLFTQKINFRGGGPIWEVGWDKQTCTHTPTHTPKDAPTRITLFARKSSLATYKWVVAIIQNTGIANHTTSGASTLLSQRDSSEGFPREQRALLRCSLYSYIMMKCTLVQQWLIHCVHPCSTWEVRNYIPTEMRTHINIFSTCWHKECTCIHGWNYVWNRKIL